MAIKAEAILRRGVIVKVKAKEEIEKTLLCYNGKDAFLHKKDFHVCWFPNLMKEYCGREFELEKKVATNAWRLKGIGGFWHPDWFEIVGK